MENLLNKWSLISFTHGMDAQPAGWGQGTRDIYSLHYVFKGSGSVEVNGQKHHVSAGQSFLVMPQVPIKYKPDKNDPWGYMWIDVIGNGASELMGQIAFLKQNPVSPAYPADEVIPLFQAVTKAERSLQAIGHFLVLLDYYIERFPSQPEKHLQPTYLQKAVAYIQANAHRPLSMTEVSDYLSISRAHLYHVFQKELNIPPGEYLLKYRMNKACDLLLHSEHSIKVIAYSLGFDNPLYFSCIFSQRMGIPPGQYRKNNTVYLGG